MNTNSIKLATALLIGSVGVASADVTMVNCVDDNVVISMSENIAIMAEEKAGSMAEMEANVCATAKQLPLDTYNEPTVVPILLEPYGISTKVTVFPTDINMR